MRKNESLPNIICFHAQQAAEKYLKGYLAQRERHVRKAHNLRLLLDACAAVDASFETLQEDVAFLDELYFSSRYPDNYTEYQSKDAEEAYRAAQRVKALVLGRLTGQHPPNANGFTAFGLVLTAVVALVVVAGAYWLLTSTRGQPNSTDSQTACPQDAKLCPDGSYVSRTGPECEFEACATADGQLPTANTDELDTSDWKTYRNEEYGFEFQHSAEFSVWKNSDGYLRVGVPLTHGGRPDGLFDLYVGGLRTRGDLTLDQFIHNDGTYKRGKYQYQDEGSGEINGVSVFWYTLLLGSGNRRHFFFLKNDDTGVDVHFHGLINGGDNPFAEKFNRIISTFKFTK